MHSFKKGSNEKSQKKKTQTIQAMWYNSLIVARQNVPIMPILTDFRLGLWKDLNVDLYLIGSKEIIRITSFRKLKLFKWQESPSAWKRKRRTARAVSCPWHFLPGQDWEWGQGRRYPVLVLGAREGRGYPVLVLAGIPPPPSVDWQTENISSRRIYFVKSILLCGRFEMCRKVKLPIFHRQSG